MRHFPNVTDVTNEEGQYQGYIQYYLQFINYPYLVNKIQDASIIYIPFFWSFFEVHTKRPHLDEFVKYFQFLSRLRLRDDQIILVFHLYIGIDDLFRLENQQCKKCVFGIYTTQYKYQQFPMVHGTGFPQLPPLIAERLNLKRDLFFVCIMGLDKNNYRRVLMEKIRTFISNNPEYKSIAIDLDQYSISKKSEILQLLPYYYSRSIFTLVPIGHVATSKRFYDAIVYGSIPVVLAYDYEFAFSDFINYSEFVIYIHTDRTDDIFNILLDYLKKPELIKKMQDAAKRAAKKLRFHTEIPVPGEGLDTLLKQLKYRYIDKKEPIKDNLPKVYR